MIVYSPDGQRLATRNSDHTARLWDAATGEEFQRLSHEDSVNSVTFSPNGTRLATASDDKTARLWDVASGQELQRLSHDREVTSVTFSPDGNRLATASMDQTARRWDAATGQELQRLSHDEGVFSVTFSPDGTRLATASMDQTARLWDAVAGQELQPLSHDGDVMSVTFSRDGKRLATASRDKTARLWDAATGKELQRLSHDEWVYSVTFSPDGTRLATASNDNTARLWDAATGKELQRLSHDGDVNSVTFSPDGKRIATASDDNTARLWYWQPEDLINQLCERMFHNLSWDQWQKYLEDEPYRKTCPFLPVHPDFREPFQRLLDQGKKAEAAEMFEQLNAADPALQLNLEKEQQKWAASKRLAEVEQLLEDYKITEALAAFDEVQQMDAAMITATQWKNLYWNGALMNFAQQVLPACEKVVADIKTQDLWMYRDSRGLARALTGNTQGAIEDFEYFIEKTDNEADKKLRQAWITALRAGQNPFTNEVLESLRAQ
ncbi:MAG: hypothetical protein ACRER2_06840 [Methylococcales bacterium]